MFPPLIVIRAILYYCTALSSRFELVLIQLLASVLYGEKELASALGSFFPDDSSKIGLIKAEEEDQEKQDEEEEKEKEKETGFSVLLD